MKTRDPSFHNPYEGLDESKLHRTTIELSGEDKGFMGGIHSRKGTLQTTIALLFHKTIQALKQNGITEYDPDRFEHAIGGCTVVLAPSTATSGSKGERSPAREYNESSEAVESNERRRAKRMAR